MPCPKFMYTTALKSCLRDERRSETECKDTIYKRRVMDDGSMNC